MTEIQSYNEMDYGAIERVVVDGDLKDLNPQQRVAYYNRVCESLGLNPYTKPFDYITLNGKLTLYARKDATEQLRKIHGISITQIDGRFADDLYIITATAQDATGRTDQATGAVSIAGLKGESKANAIMKAETKAKRRVTLSIAGLGWTDESEVDSIPGARLTPVDQDTGEITVTAVSAEEQELRQSLDRVLDELGEEVYQDKWPKVKAHNIKRVTGGQGAPNSSELQKLIDGIKAQQHQ